MVQEYCQGDLQDYLRTKGIGVGLDEGEAREIIRQILVAMMHMHKHNIVHRDLKLDNILLKEGPDGKWIAKLGDFG